MENFIIKNYNLILNKQVIILTHDVLVTILQRNRHGYIGLKV